MDYKFGFPNIEGNEIIIREGTALPAREPVQIRISGDIHSVSSFLKIRNEQQANGDQYVDETQALIIINKNEKLIQLLLRPGDPYGAEITGRLEMSDEIKPFYINQNKTFNREEFVKLLRFNKLFFDNPEKHETLLKQIMAFNAKAYIEMNAASDNRSNRNTSFAKNVETQLPADFILNVPIFKGFPKQSFRVEIAFDVTEGSVKFWLESVELHEIMQRQLDEIFNDEMKNFQGLVIINK